MAFEIKSPVLVWGAGAIGGIIGAYLIRAGHKVVFVDLVDEHIQRIAANDLTIEGPVDQFTVGSSAFHPEALEGKFELVILAVKAQHTEAATRSILPHLAVNGVILSAQNGLNEPEIARLAGAERTMGAFVNFGADWLAPGRIFYGGRGVFVLGELNGEMTPRLRIIHELIQSFEPNAVMTDNIFGYLWAKTAYGTVLAASAVTDQGINEFLGGSDTQPLITALAREVLTTAVAHGQKPMPFQGFDPTPFLRNDAQAITDMLANAVEGRRHSAKTHSGIWRDIMVRKRKTEVMSHLNPVRDAAREAGLTTPALDMLVEIVDGIENRGEKPGTTAMRKLKRAIGG